MSNLRTCRHNGFTIIELLSVIVVITLMVSLLVGASYRLVVGVRESATAATIMKANGIIQDRVRGFQEFDFTDAAFRGRDAWNLNSSNSSDKIMTPALFEIRYRKFLFKKAFPQAFAEMSTQQKTRFFGTATIPRRVHSIQNMKAG